jgi:hypothetical protein
MPVFEAVFAPLEAGQVTLTVIPDGRGQIVIDPQANRYSAGDTVHLTAGPDPGQKFLGWTGDATSASQNLDITLDRSKVIIARFSKRPRLDPMVPAYRLPDEAFRLSLTGDAGTAYEVLGSAELLATDELVGEDDAPQSGLDTQAHLLQACAALGRDHYARCVAFHSLSKRSSLPGLRSGFVAGDAEILERALYPMVNEGAKILEEGMAQRALDIDVIWVNGYGWPVYRGGPMWWADNVVGLKTIHDALLKYRDASGDPFWEPAPLLKKLVQEDKKFSTV